MLRFRADRLCTALILAAAFAACSPPAAEVRHEVSTADQFAGCYSIERVAVDVDAPLAHDAPAELPRLFRLFDEPRNDLPGYYVLGVPRTGMGAPAAGGAWTLDGDSVVVIWQLHGLAYSASLGASGDSLRGTGLEVRQTRLTSHVLWYRGLPCEMTDLVPARVDSVTRPRFPLTT
jgi:hypothetical protein